MNHGRYGRELLLELKRGDDRSLDVTGDVIDASGTNKRGGGAAATAAAAAAAPLVPPYNDELVMRCIDDVRLHIQDLRDQVVAATQLASSQQHTGGDGSNNNDNVTVSMNVRPNLVLQKASLDRNKRCLLAYHVGRIQRIKPYYWNTMILNASATTTSLLHNKNTTTSTVDDEQYRRSAANTCPAEDEFLLEYGKLVQKYTQALGLKPDDLRANGMSPPAPFDKVQVRVLSCPPLAATAGDSKENGTPMTNGDDSAEYADPSSHRKGGRGIVLDSGTSVVFAEGSTHYLLWDDVEEYVRLGYLQVLEGEEQQG